MKFLRIVGVDGNPMRNPPPDVCAGGSKEIISYLRQLVSQNNAIQVF